MADMPEMDDMADRADRADKADKADRAYSRMILPTIAYRLQIWNHDWLTGPQHQLQGDSIASKNHKKLGKPHQEQQKTTKNRNQQENYFLANS